MLAAQVSSVKECLERKQRRLSSLLARREKKIRAQGQIIQKMKTLVELHKFRLHTGTKRRAPPPPTLSSPPGQEQRGAKCAVSLKRQSKVKERPKLTPGNSMVSCKEQEDNGRPEKTEGGESPLLSSLQDQGVWRNPLATSCQEFGLSRSPLAASFRSGRVARRQESDGDSGHWSLGSPGPGRQRSDSYEKALEPDDPKVKSKQTVFNHSISYEMAVEPEPDADKNLDKSLDKSLVMESGFYKKRSVGAGRGRAYTSSLKTPLGEMRSLNLRAAGSFHPRGGGHVGRGRGVRLQRFNSQPHLPGLESSPPSPLL